MNFKANICVRFPDLISSVKVKAMIQNIVGVRINYKRLDGEEFGSDSQNNIKIVVNAVGLLRFWLF